jgi:hypothetical protein
VHAYAAHRDTTYVRTLTYVVKVKMRVCAASSPQTPPLSLCAEHACVLHLPPQLYSIRHPLPHCSRCCYKSRSLLLRHYILEMSSNTIMLLLVALPPPLPPLTDGRLN